jgi:hypothetical protein
MMDLQIGRGIYRDTGCALSPSCLNCHLPKCKYDDPHMIQRAHREKRRIAILKTHRQEELTVAELAGRFGVSERTVFRILRQNDLQVEPLGAMVPA